MLWPEKALLLGVIAIVVYLLYLSFVFVPMYDDRALAGPIFLPP